MDDSQRSGARTPQDRKYVTEHELYRVLDESLWQVERQRVDEDPSTESE